MSMKAIAKRLSEVRAAEMEDCIVNSLQRSRGWIKQQCKQQRKWLNEIEEDPKLHQPTVKKILHSLSRIHSSIADTNLLWPYRYAEQF
jgi:hypothetical protein